MLCARRDLGSVEINEWSVVWQRNTLGRASAILHSTSLGITSA